MRSIAPAPTTHATVALVSRQRQPPAQSYSSSADLEPWRDTIIQWYLKDRLKLRQVLDKLLEAGVLATKNQLKRKFTRWRVEKNSRRRPAASSPGTPSAAEYDTCNVLYNRSIITRSVSSSRYNLVIISTRLIWDIRTYYQHTPALRAWWWWDLFTDLVNTSDDLFDATGQNSSRDSGFEEDSEYTRSDSDSGSRHKALSDLPDTMDDPLITFGLIAMFTKLRTRSSIEKLLHELQHVCNSPSVSLIKELLQGIYDSSRGHHEDFQAELRTLLSEIPSSVRLALGDSSPITSTLMAWLGQDGAQFFLTINKISPALLSLDVLSSMFPTVEAYRWSLTGSLCDPRVFVNMARNFHQAAFGPVLTADQSHRDRDIRWYRGVACEFLAVAQRRSSPPGPSASHATTTGLLEEAIRYSSGCQVPHVALSQLSLLRDWYAEVGDFRRVDEVQLMGDGIYSVASGKAPVR